MKYFYSFFLILFTLNTFSQPMLAFLTQKANMPEPVSNNALCEGWTNSNSYVYSFGGIDSTKLWSGIHLKSFRYNTATDVWDTIPSLPDTLGKIAAAASYVDSIIYIIGGYHVYSNGNEASSDRVHRYDPRTNSYLTDGAPVPVPIDDHVQAVWNDSLIYVITGWSNTGNVPNIQIYDPANNQWLTGTATPNNNFYKAFGASGTIIGNTIIYHGGASTGFNFPGQNIIRIGQINPSDPTQITWSYQTTNFITYRAACLEIIGIPYWVGGSEATYNYNGIAYNGSGGVSNKSGILTYDSSMDTIMGTSMLLPIDLRGVATINPSQNYIAGGMESNQKVSNKTYVFSITEFIGVQENRKLPNFIIFPNPANDFVNLKFESQKNRTVRLLDVLGKEVFAINTNKLLEQLDFSKYPKGIYFVKVASEEESSTQKIILQ